MNQALIGDRARAIGLRTLKRAAGAVTRLVPISTPVLLVGPDSAARLGRAGGELSPPPGRLVNHPRGKEKGMNPWSWNWV